jgi:hypothetical protein
VIQKTQAPDQAQSSTESKKFLSKDLRVIGNRDLRNIFLIDNSSLNSIPQLTNFIPIIPFYFDKNDRELVKLAAFLERERFDLNEQFLGEYFNWANWFQDDFESLL